MSKKRKKSYFKFYDNKTNVNDLRLTFKKKFKKAFSSKDIEHPLFDVSKTEAKRLLITTKGLNEIKKYDPSLHRSLNKWVRGDLTSNEVKNYIDKWITQMKIKTGDTKLHIDVQEKYTTL